MIKAEYKIIADHLRSSSFLIADGVLPSNDGRGYVLRRIMRRAMRQLHKLGSKKTSMYIFVDSLIREMGQTYPELVRASDLIKSTLKNEEEKFRETLENGLKILEEEISIIDNNKKFSGKTAFKLYDTYGFPLDLTQDILKEKNIDIDLEAFEIEMEAQKQRARSSWKGSGEIAQDSLFLELKEKFGATKFIGYEQFECSAKILFISKNAIILDKTPFYATSGGQKGDNGTISSNDIILNITETRKYGGNLFVHFFEDCETKLKEGDIVFAKINIKNRRKRTANHSATHLMHKALKTIIGNSVTQKGSNVDCDQFTFDFNLNRPVSTDEKIAIENFVNQMINKKIKTQIQEMSLEEARKTGAEMLFGEKYDQEVRVVSLDNSVELCGGTHVNNSDEIEIFKIISENGIAAGIRRITAITSFEDVKNYEEAKAKLLEQESIKLQQKQREKDSDRKKIQDLIANINHLKSEKITNDVNILHHQYMDIDAKDLREIVTRIRLKDEFKESHILTIFSKNIDKVSVIVCISENLTNRFDATKIIAPIINDIGGKGGGGKKDFAMGGGIHQDKIDLAINNIKNFIKNNS